MAVDKAVKDAMNVRRWLAQSAFACVTVVLLTTQDDPSISVAMLGKYLVKYKTPEL